MATSDVQVRKDVMNNPNAWIPVGVHTSGSGYNTAQTISVVPGANAVLIQCSTQAVRFTVDGTTPTSTIGFQLFTTSLPIIIYLADGAVLKIIELAATAIVNYQMIKVGG